VPPAAFRSVGLFKCFISAGQNTHCPVCPTRRVLTTLASRLLKTVPRETGTRARRIRRPRSGRNLGCGAIAIALPELISGALRPHACRPSHILCVAPAAVMAKISSITDRGHCLPGLWRLHLLNFGGIPRRGPRTTSYSTSMTFVTKRSPQSIHVGPSAWPRALRLPRWERSCRCSGAGDRPRRNGRSISKPVISPPNCRRWKIGTAGQLMR